MTLLGMLVLEDPAQVEPSTAVVIRRCMVNQSVLPFKVEKSSASMALRPLVLRLLGSAEWLSTSHWFLSGYPEA
jgi:hypothetical protein